MTRSRFSSYAFELMTVAAALGGCAVLFTYPLGLHPASYARLDADGRFSIWNVAWVAHSLLTDPRHIWNANIFYPLQGTLAYSEANIGAGLLALPVYLATGNAYAAHNSVLLLSFVLSGLGAYCLVDYLVRDRRAACVSAICFAFCPYVFAHFSHIQLLLTGGLPFALLAYHRLADHPTLSRGAVLGVAMAAQTYACAYYGVFCVVVVGAATIVMAAQRDLWRSRTYWRAIAAAVAVSIALVAPLAAPYWSLTLSRAVQRPLVEADLYSIKGPGYLASAAYAHAWMLPLIGEWREVLFPGFIPVVFGSIGVAAGGRAGGLLRKRTWLYLLLVVLGVWLSFGPRAGLYRLLYWTTPGFSMLRAPSRFGVLVVLSLSVLAGPAVAWLLARVNARWSWPVAAATIGLALAESWSPTRFAPVPPPSEVYRQLSQLPSGPVLELPLYSERFAFLRTRYMLDSTAHWNPLVGGYSDHIPDEFRINESRLADFPSDDALTCASDVRYAVFHLKEYSDDARAAVLARLQHFSSRLRVLHRDDAEWLVEIRPAP